MVSKESLSVRTVERDLELCPIRAMQNHAFSQQAELIQFSPDFRMKCVAFSPDFTFDMYNVKGTLLAKILNFFFTKTQKKSKLYKNLFLNPF